MVIVLQRAQQREQLYREPLIWRPLTKRAMLVTSTKTKTVAMSVPNYAVAMPMSMVDLRVLLAIGLEPNS